MYGSDLRILFQAEAVQVKLPCSPKLSTANEVT
jgi:hypothetical protein